MAPLALSPDKTSKSMLAIEDACPMHSLEKKMKAVYLATFLSLVAVGPVCADDSQLTKQFSTCMDKAAGVTPVMIDCISAETLIQDARLNGAYKKLGAQVTPDRKKQLLAAQRLWVQYRDANCAFYADPDGGTIATINAKDCVMQATASRAKELKGLLE
jgi:uncharacterized protein YecT (DUF1311 family)